MKLDTTSIDPVTLWRPSSVARRMNVNPSMVTHWMDGDDLDYVVCADGTKLIPEASIAVFEELRAAKANAKAQPIEIEETTMLADA